MLILLPPSEGKASPQRGASLDLESLSHPELTTARQEMLDALVRLCTGSPAQAAESLGVGKTQLDLVARNATLATAPTARADRIYTGVLYDVLGLATLPTPAKRRASSRLAIASALFGVVRPGDRIPAYRLSGDTTLPSLGAVSAHWRKHLDPVLSDAAGRGLIVDLRSTSYATFWRPPADLATRTATVRVLHEVDGQRKVVSHFNKATKGRLVRDLLVDGGNPRTPSALAALLLDLGWTVEEAAATKQGTRLDVVVSDLFAGVPPGSSAGFKHVAE